MIRRLLGVLMLLTLVGVACTGEDNGESTAVGPTELTLMTHDSFDASEDVLAQFEEAHNVRLVLLPSGDAGTALNQAILARDNPLADVFFGVDNTFLSRALEADIFERYDSGALATVPERFQLDPSHRLLPVDYGDVCLNYDKTFFAEAGVAPPTTLDDLVDPAYAGMTVVENPATSSPGLAFLLTTVAHYGAEGDHTYLDYWREMRANDVRVTTDWNDAYYGNFTVASDGDRPIVVSYATSPPAEVLFADPPVDQAPSAAVTSPGTCYRQVEFAGILAGTEHRDLAEALVDFLLSKPFQEDIPLKMFVFPVNANASLPDLFVTYGGTAQEPAQLSPAAIDENRDAWIEAWTDVVLR